MRLARTAWHTDKEALEPGPVQAIVTHPLEVTQDRVCIGGTERARLAQPPSSGVMLVLILKLLAAGSLGSPARVSTALAPLVLPCAMEA